MNSATVISDNPRHRTMNRRAVAARIFTLICLAIALVVHNTPSASAISRYSLWQGSPGAIVQSSQVVGWPSYAGTAPKVSIFAAHVRRSPLTTGQQTVVYEYRLYGWNGTSWWGGTATYGLSRTIPAGQSTVVLDGNGYGGSTEITGLSAGYVAVELTATFYSAGGQFLGRFKAWHDQAGDYVCARGVTLYGSCQVYSGGYVRLS